MSNEELSNEFDILYNSITSNKAPGLDEYEKSVFLTLGEYDVVKSYISAKTNKLQEGINDSSQRDIAFSKLIYTYIPKTIENVRWYNYDNARGFELDIQALGILNEYVEVKRNNKTTYLTVIPLNHRELSRVMSKPNNRPFKREAWRFMDSPLYSVIVPGPGDEILSYAVRYVKVPSPIIITNLEEGLSILGQHEETKCELDESFHMDIVRRAAELAKATYQGDLNAQLALSQVSQTNLGFITSNKQQ